MIRPFLTVIGLLALLAVLLASSGCTSHRLQYTFTKANVSEQQLNQDLKELQRTQGVEQVLHRYAMDRSVTIQVYVDEDDPLPGKQTAADLGYSQVRD